jgi:hypothetical protein
VTIDPLPDWFHRYADKYFERHLAALSGEADLRFLQVGVYTGDATVWLFENVLTHPSSRLEDVDMWGGSTEPGDQGLDFTNVESTYDSRTEKFRASGQLTKCKGESAAWFASMPQQPTYDFIYIDGDHSAFGVINDAVDAYRLLKIGGILAFDDYLWRSGEGYLRDPAHAIDSFLYLYADRFSVLAKATQVWLQRTN